MRRLSRALSIVLLIAGMGLFAASCRQTVAGPRAIGGTKIVPEGQRLVFDPNRSTTLTITGNLIIKGTLEMRPARPNVVHKIVFANARESAFQGARRLDEPPLGGFEAVDTDVGLWVLGSGRLDVSGTPREPWANAASALTAGQRTITLDRPPTGWQPGDELSVTPTAPDDHTGFDEVRIASIAGRTIRLTSGLAHSHPAVTIPTVPATVRTAEVLNLTRNVQIEGMRPAHRYPTASTEANDPGRAHVFISNTRPVKQRIDYTAIRYVGPRRWSSGTDSKDFLGRYGLHFHMSCRRVPTLRCDNNAGTAVTGTVVRDSGSHAFVPHMSDGITFRRTIAYQTQETPYWWDVAANDQGPANHPTNYNRYVETVAAGVGSATHGPMRAAGYSLGCGNANIVERAVAVGVLGHVQTSGFFWPEGANGCPNTWIVRDDVAHNNQNDGMFMWQNDVEDPHDRTFSFTSYRNGGACIEHGAYRNGFDGVGAWCVEDLGAYHPSPTGGEAAVVIHAVSPSRETPTDASFFERVKVRTGAPHALRILFHRVEADVAKPTVFRGWDVDAATNEVVEVAERNPDSPSPPRTPQEEAESSHRGAYDFVCWTLPGGAELEPSNFTITHMDPRSVYRIQRRNGTAYRLYPNGTTAPISPAPYRSCN